MPLTVIVTGKSIPVLKMKALSRYGMRKWFDFIQTFSIFKMKLLIDEMRLF